MELEQVAGWLWCLRTPIVQAYAVLERDGFNLIDTSTAGQHDAILAALAGIDGRPVNRVRVYEMLLTHAHDDHTGSAAALTARTGALVVAPKGDAPVITRDRPSPAPELADWEVPLFKQVMAECPPSAASRPRSPCCSRRPPRLAARCADHRRAGSHAGPCGCLV